MNTHCKFCVIPLLVSTLVPNISSMELNTINIDNKNNINNHNLINTNQNVINNSNPYIINSVNQNNININDQNLIDNIQNNITQQHNNNESYEYGPIPTSEEIIKFMKVNVLDPNNEQVQKCFKDLREYDIKNYVLLNNLLKEIYYTAYKISNGHVNYRLNIVALNNIDDLLKYYREVRLDDINNYNSKYHDAYQQETQCQDINKSMLQGHSDIINQLFNMLRQYLNSEKYKEPLYDNIKPTKFVQFCYYISNVLVLLSHDIVYAIKKESDQLKNNYNNKEQLKLISQNISNIITRSFNIIIDAFTFFSKWNVSD